MIRNLRPMRGHRTAANFGHCVVSVMVMFLLPALASSTPPANGFQPLAAGAGQSGPWWMRQTALGPDGQFGNLQHQPWWSKACRLQVGEAMSIDADGQAAGHMLVRRERFRNRSQEGEALVWVIDDDADGSIKTGGDTNSDCYVVDYGPDGVVDRMVDYLDNDRDGDPDEMDIRYFVDGQLRQLWCGFDLDDDSSMWDLAGYEYSGDFFRSDPYGNSMIFMNKFDPQRGQWIPISECPFAFYDTDDDGFSEMVIRVSAVPIDYDHSTDPDYANDVRRYRGDWSDAMRQMGVVNLRISFDVDNRSGKNTPLHYDYGFNLVGATPYEFAGMEHTNPKRRPPQITRVIPHTALPAICAQYEARETGFSWHEHHDDTISIGSGERADLDYRWEGVFWIWERRFMENTGGPNQKWNVRREWSRQPGKQRKLYYSGVDRRIHLFGAEEGWIEIGHFGGLGKLAEVRMIDTDDNGYFDRWEVYRAGRPTPVRVTTVRDEKAEMISTDYEKISKRYTQDILPEALAANRALMAAMDKVHAYATPEGLRQAMRVGAANNRRFAQDVARELQYQDLRRRLAEQAHQTLDRAEMNDLRKLDAKQRLAPSTSQSAWHLVRLLAQLEVAYGQGDFDQSCQLLDEIATMAQRSAE